MAKPGTPRRARKRVNWSSLPKPQPVAAIWEAASDAEKEMAHRTGAVLLQYWSGRVTKAEAAAQLELPPLRVWQLSRLGLSGMVCGLLRQPRRRAAGVPPMTKNDDLKAWKKRAEKAERKAELLQELVDLLSEFPGNREKLEARLKEKSPGEKKKAQPGGAETDRGVDPGETTPKE